MTNIALRCDERWGGGMTTVVGSAWALEWGRRGVSDPTINARCACVDHGAPFSGVGTHAPVSAVTFLPFFEGDAGDGEEGVAGVNVGAEAVHAAYGVEFFGADVGAGAVFFGDDELVF